jgi:cytochrome c553
LPTQPPPDAGPGSTGSQAHQYFNSTVYPMLAVCQACHSTGTDGAPKMMDSPADTTYSELDALGLIVTNSQILSQGSHDTGKAPALTSTQQSAITQWLSLEAAERVGTAAPANLMVEIGACASQSDWDAIPWTDLRTQKRTDEQANKCTGCDDQICASCHSGGDQGFYMAEGSAFDTNDTTFMQTFKANGPSMMTYINKFFGLNGATPVASNAIANKATAVAAGPAYSHPMFVIPATVQTGMDKFVTDAITAYTNHTCTAPTDGGTTGDAGQ